MGSPALNPAFVDTGRLGEVEVTRVVLLLGILLSISFGGSGFTPQVMAAEPARQAAPKQAPKSSFFLIFFDWSSREVSPNGIKRIDDVVAAAEGAREVRIIGHTDMSESNDHELSLARAMVIHKALIGKGVPAPIIAIVGSGNARLLVPTKAGEREPQNRRVEIAVTM